LNRPGQTLLWRLYGDGPSCQRTYIVEGGREREEQCWLMYDRENLIYMVCILESDKSTYYDPHTNVLLNIFTDFYIYIGLFHTDGVAVIKLL
jgi:hypothetical protein